jgi:uncharacterized protein YkwD
MPGLPPGWEKVLDRSSGQYYFYNARLGVTQWDPPQVGAQKTKATFVTTTTTRKVVKKPRPAPVAYQNQHYTNSRPAHTTTVVQRTHHHTTAAGGGGGGNCCAHSCICGSGDAIFVAMLLTIVLVLVICMNTVGQGTAYSNSIVSPYAYGGNEGSAFAGSNMNSLTSGCGASSEECVQLKEVVRLVNTHRQSIGVDAMGSNTMLNQAAQRHSCFMAAYNTMSHTGGPQPEYREMANRVTKTGYQFSRVGENVAAGQPTAESVMEAWLNSPGHRRNIENAEFDEIGLGIKSSETGLRYWTQVFGKQQTTAKKGTTNDACVKQIPDL